MEIKASAWSIEKARALYNIEGWGAGFFDIDSRFLKCQLHFTDGGNKCFAFRLC